MPADGMAAVLADPAQRAAHVSTLVNLAVANGYAGITHYEQFVFADGTSSWAATRPLWVQFISELGGASTPGRAPDRDHPADLQRLGAPGSGYWVYDWGGIARSSTGYASWPTSTASRPPGPSPRCGGCSRSWPTRSPSCRRRRSRSACRRRVQLRRRCDGHLSERGRAGPLRRAQRQHCRPHPGEGRHPGPRPASGEMTFSYVETFTGPPPCWSRARSPARSGTRTSTR